MRISFSVLLILYASKNEIIPATSAYATKYHLLSINPSGKNIIQHPGAADNKPVIIMISDPGLANNETHTSVSPDTNANTPTSLAEEVAVKVLIHINNNAMITLSNA